MYMSIQYKILSQSPPVWATEVGKVPLVGKATVDIRVGQSSRTWLLVRATSDCTDIDGGRQMCWHACNYLSLGGEETGGGYSICTSAGDEDPSSGILETHGAHIRGV